MLFYRAALPLSHQTLSYVAGVIRRHRARIGSCWRKRLNPNGTDRGPKFADYIVSANKVVADAGRLGATPEAHWRMSPPVAAGGSGPVPVRPGAQSALDRPSDAEGRPSRAPALHQQRARLPGPSRRKTRRLIHSSYLSESSRLNSPAGPTKLIHISTGQGERFLRMTGKPGQDNGPAV